MNPRFPLYVVSKGRYEKRLTSDSLCRYGVPHHVVVEAQEYDDYATRVGDLAEVVILDPEYQRIYETCDDRGDSLPVGAGAARNFVWDHSIRAGYPWHWVMDDNIDGFYRLNRNLKTPVADGTIFYVMEEFALRYSNLAMAGPNYFMFASRKTKMPPFVANTRIYSCNLIRNSVPFRWRCRYNEDTDLSLRLLKAGYTTVLFNAFLQMKTTTMTMRGGNADELYADEGRRHMAEMIAEQHPDVARVSFKWGRVQHHVDYSGFRTPLEFEPDVDLEPGGNEFGMVLQQKSIRGWETVPTSILSRKELLNGTANS